MKKGSEDAVARGQFCFILSTSIHVIIAMMQISSSIKMGQRFAFLLILKFKTLNYVKRAQKEINEAEELRRPTSHNEFVLSTEA